MNENARPSLHVPLVCYRGLWDKFAGPGSAGAVRRAYLRNVACVVRASEGERALEEACAIVADPAVNRHGHALLMADDRDRSVAPLLYLRSGSDWLPCGSYVPVRAVRKVSAADLETAIATAVPWILVESSNVLEARDEQRILGGMTDDGVMSMLSELAPAGARFARVSDFVELDLLDRQREAA